MRTDVFVKSWYNDLHWLSYCLRFLEKNWVEPNSQVIVLANADCRPVIETWGFPRERFRYFYVQPWPDGNQFECYLTLLFDHFSDAELFAVFDSDTMLWEPMRASYRCQGDKPIIYFARYDDEQYADDAEFKMARQLWGPLMERWLGIKPWADYMLLFPFLYRADSIRAVRRLITSKTGEGLLESLHSDTVFDPKKFLDHPFKFSEHNVIGFYCDLHESDRYHLCDIRKLSAKARALWPVRKYHSWTEWSPRTQAELEAKYASA
jgi:hypothetical protein